MVNSADTSVFQTEAEGSMPSDRSLERAGADCAPASMRTWPSGKGTAPSMRRSRVRVPSCAQV
nr:hypothetical protein [Kibdelosporangium sp. MJ126-NF4]